MNLYRRVGDTWIAGPGRPRDLETESLSSHCRRQTIYSAETPKARSERRGLQDSHPVCTTPAGTDHRSGTKQRPTTQSSRQASSLVHGKCLTARRTHSYSLKLRLYPRRNGSIKPRAGFEPAMGGSAGRCVRPDSATLAHSHLLVRRV